MHSRLICSAIVVAAFLSSTAPGQAISPREELTKPVAIERPGFGHELVVKFRDRVRARAADGRVRSDAGVEMSRELPLLADRAIEFRQLISLPQPTLDALQARARAASGVTQPDLAGMMVVHAPDARLDAVADALLASDLTEWVCFQELLPPPPCEDILPTTPQYFPARQGYHGPNPGLSMPASWARGGRGQGVTIADCEYGYVAGHEDLCNIVPEPGQTIHPDVINYGWDEHGTAVFGEMISLDNAYGCTGLVPDASGMFFPEWTVEDGGRRVTAIANAIASVRAGDIVLLEMQTTGSGGGYGPAELDPAVWTVVRVGTDAGVVVVAAAGNGGQNLDAPVYQEYRDRGDSGAIIVGAGSPDTSHNAYWWSTYGSRVNVQGWGGSVFSTGYGDYAQHGGDKNQRYTSGFSGTSSASPFIASSAASLQSVSLVARGRPLLPRELRRVLIDTGIPQGTGGHVGPFPDLDAASVIVACAADFNLDGSVSTVDVLAFLNVWTSHGPGADFNGDGAVDTRDVRDFLNAWNAGCPG